MHDSTLQVMENGYYGNSNATPYYFKNSSCLYLRFQPDLGNPNQVPEFENCNLFNCNTKALKDSAVIYLNGKNKLYGCEFKEGQILVIDDDIELYNCKNVKIRFASAKTYNLKVEGTNLSFDGATSNHSVRMNIIGGELLLPDVTMYAAWRITAEGTKVTVNGGYIYSKVDLTGCTVQAVDEVYFGKVQNCNIFFGGTNNVTAKLSGLSFIGNEIRSGTPAGDLNKKAKVVFNGWNNIGNIVQGIYGTGPIAMEKGSDAKVVFGNYNGATAL